MENIERQYNTFYNTYTISVIFYVYKKGPRLYFLFPKQLIIIIEH